MGDKGKEKGGKFSGKLRANVSNGMICVNAQVTHLEVDKRGDVPIN